MGTLEIATTELVFFAMCMGYVVLPARYILLGSRAPVPTCANFWQEFGVEVMFLEGIRRDYGVAIVDLHSDALLQIESHGASINDDPASDAFPQGSILAIAQPAALAFFTEEDTIPLVVVTNPKDVRLEYSTTIFWWLRRQSFLEGRTTRAGGPWELIGKVVTLRGLSSDQGRYLNGRTGKMLKYNEERKRCAVELTSASCVKTTHLIRPSNIEVDEAETTDTNVTDDTPSMSIFARSGSNYKSASMCTIIRDETVVF